jgi:hypothetical protein
MHDLIFFVLIFSFFFFFLFLFLILDGMSWQTTYVIYAFSIAGTTFSKGNYAVVLLLQFSTNKILTKNIENARVEHEWQIFRQPRRMIHLLIRNFQLIQKRCGITMS